ncbi:MAG: PD40 domain-containing protein [candidate division Zixibacteria bacterium]|nr:PD40 domain-containing protein [candidate division Zixibacteria bacterium]
MTKPTRLTGLLILLAVLGLGYGIQFGCDGFPFLGSAAMAQSAAPDSSHTAATATPGWGQMSPEQRERAVSYSTTRHILQFGGFAYSVVILLVVLFSGFSQTVLAWCRKITARRVGIFLLYLTAFQIAYMIASFPLDYYQGFYLEHQFDLSNQTFVAWLIDSFKSQAIALVILIPVVGALYALIRRQPRSWWAWFGLGAVPFAVFFIIIAPIVITPMFYKTTPLADGPLKTQILNLAEKSGISDSRIFVMDASKDTKKLNAYVTGLGRTKRIVLFDNLVNSMTPPEILFVLGHEMGHYVLHHIWILLSVAIGLIFLVGYVSHLVMGRIISANHARFGFDQLSSFASFPLIMLCVTVLGFLMSPIQNGLSRYFEHRADIFGLERTHSGEAAAAAFEKLASVNLSNPDPSPFVEFWLFDHPALSERVRFARSYSPEDAAGGGGAQSQASAPAAATADSLQIPGEKHLANIRQLTFGGENAEAYFDGTGKMLTFQSRRDNWDCDRIFLMGTDGSNVRQLSVRGGTTTCSFFAPDDRRVVYCSTYLVDDSCPPKPSYEHGYVWSLYKGFDVFSVKTDGTDLQRLTTTPGYDAEAVYSPDGKKILFTSARDGDLELYTMNPDGSNQTRLTHEVGYDGGGFFSADSRRIVYRAHHPASPEAIADYKKLLADGLIRPSTLEIFVMNADGSDKKQITSNGAANFCPYFHPNGKKIIFVSNMDDPKKRNFDIYLINVDGTGLERVTYNQSFDGFPMFNKDATKLVFASNRNESKPGETNIFIADWVE